MRLAFADSEVASVRLDGDTLVLRFSAARMAGDPTLYLPGLVLTMPRAQLEAPLAGCIGRIAEGEALVDGQRHRLLDLPAAITRPVRLSLRFANGSPLDVTGAALIADLPPDTAAAEHYHC
jgi:hypothetical protein